MSIQCIQLPIHCLLLMQDTQTCMHSGRMSLTSRYVSSHTFGAGIIARGTGAVLYKDSHRPIQFRFARLSR